MTDPEGNGELCFPETLNVFFGFASGKIAFEGKQNSLLPAGQVMKCFVIPPNSKLEKTMKKLFALRWPAHKFAVVSRSRFDPQQATRFPPIEKRI